MKRLRNSDPAAVIYLAMGLIVDRVQGLEAGSDESLVKPFAFPQWLARVRALTLRSEAVTSLTVGTIEINLLERTVTRARVSLELPPQESE